MGGLNMTATELITLYDQKIQAVKEILDKRKRKKEILPQMKLQAMEYQKIFDSIDMGKEQLNLKQATADLEKIDARIEKCDHQLTFETDEAKKAALQTERSILLNQKLLADQNLAAAKSKIFQKETAHNQLFQLNKEIPKREKMELGDDSEYTAELAQLTKERESKLINLAEELMERVHWITAETASAKRGMDEAKRIFDLQIAKETERLTRFTNSSDRIKAEYDTIMVAIGQVPHFAKPAKK